MDTISTGKYLELAYKIYSIDGNGDRTLEYEFTTEAPDRFVYGVEPGLLEDFSKKLQGLAMGENFNFTLTPEQAFGERHNELVMELERSMFNDPEGNFMSDIVQVGKTLTMMTNEGQPAPGLVLNIDDKNVTMDFNHRLAGKSVEYEGRVMLVRDATPDDLPKQHSCGCSCDSCGGGCDGCGSSCDDHDGCGCH